VPNSWCHNMVFSISMSELGCLDAFNVGGSLCSNLIHSSHNLEHSLKPLFQKGGLGDSLHSTPPWGGIARVRGSALLAAITGGCVPSQFAASRAAGLWTVPVHRGFTTEFLRGRGTTWGSEFRRRASCMLSRVAFSGSIAV
jgi:hypothetical protein